MDTVGLLYEARPTRHMLSAHDINHRRYLRCVAVCFTCLCLCIVVYVPVYNQAHARHADTRSEFQRSNDWLREDNLFQPKVQSKKSSVNSTINYSRSPSDSKTANQLSFGEKGRAGEQTLDLISSVAAGLVSARASSVSRISRRVGRELSDNRTSIIVGWSHNTSRDLRLYVRPNNQTAMIPQPEICTGELFLLIVVCSAVPNWEARAAIRDTWGSWSFPNSSITLRIAFLLGDPDNATLQEQVDEESLQFGDIVQEGFLDSYNNLTVKSVMLLKWVTSHCHSLRYVMKTDDDMFVNVDSLVKLLQSRSAKSPLLLGTLICGAHPISDAHSKWFAPRYMFSGRVYPNYLSGTGYVMSAGIAALLYQAALTTPLFHLEDVYVTGLCAHVAGVRPRDHPAFTYARRRLDPCLYRHPSVVTSHRLTPAELRRVWTLMRAPDLDCSAFALPTTSRPSKQRAAALRHANKCF